MRHVRDAWRAAAPWLVWLLASCTYSGYPGGASVSSVFPLDHLQKPLLPPGSGLYTVGGDDLHVRTLGGREPEPAVVLLSGPTASWHSDSAWFAMLQPLLARDMRTHAVDRAGQAFSSGDGRGGYAGFGEQLETLLPELSDEPVVVVAFASADLALLRYFERHPDGGRISAVLLIDPDAVHPDLIDFYAEQATPFQNPKLLRYVREGGYDERARALNDADQAHVLSILPAGEERAFEKRYFERVLATRLDRDKIVARFREIARYDRDIQQAAPVPWPPAVRVWSFDTDFELDAVDAAATREERARYERWRALGSEWMAALPGGCHLRTESREHLATIAQAPELAELVRKLRAGDPCPRSADAPEQVGVAPGNGSARLPAGTAAAIFTPAPGFKIMARPDGWTHVPESPTLPADQRLAGLRRDALAEALQRGVQAVRPLRGAQHGLRAADGRR